MKTSQYDCWYGPSTSFVGAYAFRQRLCQVLSIVAIVIIVALAFSSSSWGLPLRSVARDGVKARTEPQLSAPVEEILSKGVNVAVINRNNQDGRWLLIQIFGKKLWIQEEDLEPPRPLVPKTQIRRLQVLLSRLGYDVGIIDGKYGPRTIAAVISFQRKFNLVDNIDLDFVLKVENYAPDAEGNQGGDKSTKTQLTRKKIFRLVTLGERISTVKARLGKPTFEKEDSILWNGKGPGESLFVLSAEGRVAAVGATYEPRSWITLRRVLNIISRKYGSPRIHDYFPDYADSDSSKSTSINIGKGQVSRSWDLGDWKIVLIWTQKTLFLRYEHKDLWKKYQEAKESGY